MFAASKIVRPYGIVELFLSWIVFCKLWSGPLTKPKYYAWATYEYINTHILIKKNTYLSFWGFGDSFCKIFFHFVHWIRFLYADSDILKSVKKKDEYCTIPSVGLYSTGFWRFFGFFSKTNMESPQVHRTGGCREIQDLCVRQAKIQII